MATKSSNWHSVDIISDFLVSFIKMMGITQDRVEVDKSMVQLRVERIPRLETSRIRASARNLSRETNSYLSAAHAARCRL